MAHLWAEAQIARKRIGERISTEAATMMLVVNAAISGKSAPLKKQLKRLRNGY